MSLGLLLGRRGGGRRSRLLQGWLRRDRLWRSCPAHGLKLLQSLAIERRMGRLRDAILVGRRSLSFGLDLLLCVGRKVEVSQVFLAVVAGIDHMGLMTTKLRAVKQEPERSR